MSSHGRFYRGPGVAARQLPAPPTSWPSSTDAREVVGRPQPHALLPGEKEELDRLPAVHADLPSGLSNGPILRPHLLIFRWEVSIKKNLFML